MPCQVGFVAVSKEELPTGNFPCPEDVNRSFIHHEENNKQDLGSKKIKIKWRVSNSQQFLWTCCFRYPCCEFLGKRVGYTRAEFLGLNTSKSGGSRPAVAPDVALGKDHPQELGHCKLCGAPSPSGGVRQLISALSPKMAGIHLWGHLGTWGGEREVARGWWESQRMLQPQEVSQAGKDRTVWGFYSHPQCPCPDVEQGIVNPPPL